MKPKRKRKLRTEEELIGAMWETSAVGAMLMNASCLQQFPLDEWQDIITDLPPSPKRDEVKKIIEAAIPLRNAIASFVARLPGINAGAGMVQ